MFDAVWNGDSEGINCSIVVCPSGTEPKLKTYISVSAENKEAAEKVEAEICKSAEEFLK